MRRIASDATKLRDTRSDLLKTLRERNEAINQASAYRNRAQILEAEVAEWKARFDLLLRRTPALDKSK